MMTRWTSSFGAVLLVLAVACGGDDTDQTNDTGIVEDSVVADVVEDTSVADEGQAPDLYQPDTATGTDTNQVQDEGQAVDNTHVDTYVPTECPKVVVTGSKCYEAAACWFVACDNNETYREQCLEQSDDTVDAMVKALNDCIETAGCEDIFVNEHFSECVRDNCLNEVDACFVTEDNLCWEIRTCRRLCSADDKSCPMRCLGEGDTTEQENWANFTDCVLDVDCAATNILPNGWLTEECEGYAAEQCYTQAQACSEISG